ncbi:hypothetical protein [Kosakonia pseudosacchari]|uniref:Uncharacterized protein n=1 Tax=Kosakonia pseudosacchari TaxID=1646340 RepID=A0ABX4IJN3_9ENTR|nr:hypothetical protein [Kosakonia pseudosacchari]PDO82608.1 hypothetical protein BK796_22345 [Kosakonia pseudosacchari]
MIKKITYASAMLLAASASASFSASAATKTTASKCPATMDVDSVEIRDGQQLMILTKAALENYEMAVAKDAKCVSMYRETYRAKYLPELKKLDTGTSEPLVKLKTAPLLAAFENAMQPDVEIKETNSRVDAYYAVANAYLETAMPGKWKVAEDNDEMRGEKTYLYTLESEDVAKLSPPYKEAKATILVMQKEKEGVISDPKIMYYVSDGQLTLPVEGGEIAAKYDDDGISRYNGKICSDDNRSFCPDLAIYQLFAYLDVRSSHKAIIELPFYIDGRYQYHFKTTGLITRRTTPDYLLQKKQENRKFINE